MDKKDELIAVLLRWAELEQAMFDAEGGVALMHAMADSVQADEDLRRAVEDYKSQLSADEN